MDTEIKTQLIGKLTDKSARVAVIGIGYVGLPLVVTFAEAGFTVIGVDPDQRKVDAVKRGESYILDITNEQLAPLVKKGLVSATSDFSVVKDVQAVSICVPTPLRKTGDPDLSFIVSATESIAPYLHPGMVVVLESSTYPGTTRELVLPRLSEASHLDGRQGLLPGILTRKSRPRSQGFYNLQYPQSDRWDHTGLFRGCQCLLLHGA